MENLDAKAVECLIAEYRQNQQIAIQARERNRAIADRLGPGRADGLEEYFYIQPPKWVTRLDVSKLRRYVPAATLNLCLVSVQRSRTVTIKKINPKNKKKAA